jgi:hypothetical protein
MASEHLNAIEWDARFGFPVRIIGSIPVTFGLMAREDDDDEGSDTPRVFGAALSEQDLRRESCGYGASTTEAAADLFRLLRPQPRGLADLLGGRA